MSIESKSSTRFGENDSDFISSSMDRDIHIPFNRKRSNLDSGNERRSRQFLKPAFGGLRLHRVKSGAEKYILSSDGSPGPRTVSSSSLISVSKLRNSTRSKPKPKPKPRIPICEILLVAKLAAYIRNQTALCRRCRMSAANTVYEYAMVAIFWLHSML